MNSDALASIIVAVLLLSIASVSIWAIFAWDNKNKQRRKELQKLAEQKQIAQASRDAEVIERCKTELQDFIRDAEAGNAPNLNGLVQGFILKPGEICCFRSGNVEHLVPHKETSYVGGSHGASIRVMKGVSYRVGSFRGHPVTTTTEQVHDRGHLYITNQRIVFAGSVQVVTLALNKMADARVDGDRVGFMAENKPYPMIFRLCGEEKYRGTLVRYAAEIMAEQLVNSSVSKAQKRTKGEA